MKILKNIYNYFKRIILVLLESILLLILAIFAPNYVSKVLTEGAEIVVKENKKKNKKK